MIGRRKRKDAMRIPLYRDEQAAVDWTISLTCTERLDEASWLGMNAKPGEVFIALEAHTHEQIANDKDPHCWYKRRGRIDNEWKMHMVLMTMAAKMAEKKGLPRPSGRVFRDFINRGVRLILGRDVENVHPLLKEEVSLSYAEETCYGTTPGKVPWDNPLSSPMADFERVRKQIEKDDGFRPIAAIGGLNVAKDLLEKFHQTFPSVAEHAATIRDLNVGLQTQAAQVLGELFRIGSIVELDGGTVGRITGIIHDEIQVEPVPVGCVPSVEPFEITRDNHIDPLPRLGELKMNMSPIATTTIRARCTTIVVSVGDAVYDDMGGFLKSRVGTVLKVNDDGTIDIEMDMSNPATQVFIDQFVQNQIGGLGIVGSDAMAAPRDFGVATIDPRHGILPDTKRPCDECGGSGFWMNPAGGRNAKSICSQGCPPA